MIVEPDQTRENREDAVARSMRLPRPRPVASHSANKGAAERGGEGDLAGREQRWQRKGQTHADELANG